MEDVAGPDFVRVVVEEGGPGPTMVLRWPILCSLLHFVLQSAKLWFQYQFERRGSRLSADDAGGVAPILGAVSTTVRATQSTAALALPLSAVQR